MAVCLLTNTVRTQSTEHIHTHTHTHTHTHKHSHTHINPVQIGGEQVTGSIGTTPPMSLLPAMPTFGRMAVDQPAGGATPTDTVTNIISKLKHANLSTAGHNWYVHGTHTGTITI